MDKAKVKKLIGDNIVVVVLILLCIGFGLASNTFFSSRNISNIMSQMCHNALLACGLTYVIILGGIYSGIVTPTEAACVSVFYALIVSLWIYKSMKVSDIMGFLKSAVRSYAPLCLLLAFAVAFGRILTLVNGPAVVAEFLTNTFSSRFTFLLALDIAMLIMGMFMDTGSAIAILGPILLVTAKSFGVHEVQFGIILVTNLAVGLVSPPVGINLFVGAPLVDESPTTIGKAALPAIGFFLIALLLITYIPAL